MADGDGKLGLAGAAAIGLGGMIGGGVFSVLGVVATIAGSAAWLAFTAASLISMAAAYSYVKLNQLSDDGGGSVTMIESFVGNSTLAGMVGWTLLVGYVGAVAMYAFAFGGFAERLLGFHSLFGFAARPLLSVLAVAGFVGLNLVGANATGTSEKLLVGLKLAILLGISGWGLYYGHTIHKLGFGFGTVATTGFVTAVAISFVSFQGWQLVMYDRESIKNPAKNIPRAAYIGIVGAIIVDSLVAILVTSLVSTEVITKHPEIAVAHAVEPFLGHLGFVFVAVAALFSTGSAINGTLFSSAHFAKGMLSDGLLPDQLGTSDTSGIPTQTALVLGGAAAALTFLGSLEAITSFGSLAFMVVFGSMSYLAFRQRDDDRVSAVVPAVGVIGTVGLFPLLLYHLYAEQLSVFTTVLVLAVGILVLELVYFERDAIEDGISTVEKRI